jgi:hypothetical protein
MRVKIAGPVAGGDVGTTVSGAVEPPQAASAVKARRASGLRICPNFIVV